MSLFTTATGEPIMYIVIIEGKRIKSKAVAGLDILTTLIGKGSGPDFTANNAGPCKIYFYGLKGFALCSTQRSEG